MLEVEAWLHVDTSGTADMRRKSVAVAERKQEQQTSVYSGETTIDVP